MIGPLAVVPVAGPWSADTVVSLVETAGESILRGNATRLYRL